ncbi:hypothetical protein MCOR27_004452 [Pyricularia oryzae]|uniref:Methyltransferase domain-containing protein n=2 Tax=Pyricularia TaxID=48558 RepID=A0ABQ8NF08_PYRGI|nr:hypothetical protein MCOR01_001035 [Pyricularia oryzae]KAI6295978.1 hypothetical protein MCOR33_007276 [Pyricularia grisea]KAH9430449.1 hypothetical protein MCOR02_010150 [Pyricularia oryzae]KAI6255149.1 hypothetical protein MCOR19_008359 [Pyricularia oryzae]KAI6271025.1 hypothetical protein MCOR26_007978 [Pyricularia oryzae]
MIPRKLLPISDDFESEEDYVEKLLQFVTTTDIFQILCGGVHILDFFASEPGVFYAAIPEEWQKFLLEAEPWALLDFLMRDDLDTITAVKGSSTPPPASLVQYIRSIRKFSLRRTVAPHHAGSSSPTLPRHISVGMKPKKIHEVASFADYVNRLAGEFDGRDGEISHLVDFGSGQNYLGRTLAAEPYSRHIIAVEGREANINGAKALDRLAGVAGKIKLMRNKKAYMQYLDSKATPEKKQKASEKTQRRLAMGPVVSDEEFAAADLRSRKEIGDYDPGLPVTGKGYIHYVAGRLETGDLAGVLNQVRDQMPEDRRELDLRLLAVSIHSCGNLSHYGIRSMLMNPTIRAVAIVGCCYNLMTERLGPPTFKPAFERPTFDSVNGRVRKEEERKDPQGFPMSNRLGTYRSRKGAEGVRLNITARMMACQAPQNWTEAESAGFYDRHFYRAVLQRVLLDRGAITKLYYREDAADGPITGGEGWKETPFNMSTNPVIIGSLRKQCYTSLTAYIRGAIDKLMTNDDYSQYSAVIKEKVSDITDEEIESYNQRYGHRRNELSSVWSLMAFSACVVESLIATDRWLFLKEHPDHVRDAWVEPVFDYRQSPRNLVVVGIKK